MSLAVLITLGRLPKGLDVARSFAQAGWRVIVADPFARHLLGASRAVAKSYQVTAPSASGEAFLADLARIVGLEGVSLVVPISEEAIHVAALRERLPASVRVYAMPQAALVEAHDKARFVAFALAHGLAAPETHAIESDGARALAQSAAYIVKPRHACAGAGVQRFSQSAPLPEHPGAIVQRLVTGAEYSACAMAHDGLVQVCSVYRATLTSGTVAVGFERVDHAAIHAWVSRYVAAARWTGFISFDFMVDEEGAPWGIECNPRLTSGVHFFETSEVAAAILDPAARVGFRVQRRLQQFWPCLSETQASFGDWRRFRANLRTLLGSRDVTWSWRDPWPLLGMPWTAWRIIKLSRRYGVSFGEAATMDIVWGQS